MIATFGRESSLSALVVCNRASDTQNNAGPAQVRSIDFIIEIGSRPQTNSFRSFRPGSGSPQLSRAREQHARPARARLIVETSRRRRRRQTDWARGRANTPIPFPAALAENKITPLHLMTIIMPVSVHFFPMPVLEVAGSNRFEPVPSLGQRRRRPPTVTLANKLDHHHHHHHQWQKQGAQRTRASARRSDKTQASRAAASSFISESNLFPCKLIQLAPENLADE